MLEFRLNEHSRNFLVVLNVADRTCETESVTDFRESTREGDPLFHDSIRETFSGRPVFRKGFAVEGFLVASNLEGRCTRPAPMPALYRVPAPWLFIPEASVLITVI